MTSKPTNPTPTPVGAVLVVGGGISGMQSALDLANSGYKVYMVESSPAIGGKMAQLDKTFPTNDCSMCIVSPKLVEVGRHLNIDLYTHSELTNLAGTAGQFTATVKRRARYVDIGKCTGCGLCELYCPVDHHSRFPDGIETDGKRTFPKAKIKHIITGKAGPKPSGSEAWTFEVDKESCSTCGLCHRVCLQQAIVWQKKEIASIDQEKCTGCGACYTACPDKFSAINISDAPEMDNSMGAAIVARSQELRKKCSDSDKGICIRCGLCTLMCREVMGINALKIHEKGIQAGVDSCQMCGSCVSVCPVDFLSMEKVTNGQPKPLLDTFNEGLNTRKAVHIHYPQAVPRVPTIDETSCVRLNTGNCGICASVCGVGAINYEDTVVEETLTVGSVIYSPGFEVSDAGVREEFGYGVYKNVVTSIEFERLLSASGPTSGAVLRPGDNSHPKKIAWIQCVGSRDHSCNREYCSSVCCMYATKEAYIAREHDSSIEPTIFYIDMRSFGKNFDEYVKRAEEHSVRYVRAMVSRLYEDPVTGNLEIRYVDETGMKQRETFEMVVLSVGIQMSDSSRELAHMLRIDTDSYGFAATDVFNPQATSRAGIFASGAFNGPKDIPETVSEASGAAQAAAEGIAESRGSLIVEEQLPEEQPPGEDEELRIGVFICHCGSNIASVVDVEAVMDYAATLPGVVYTDHPLYTCSQDSQERMRAIIEENRLNRIVVSACSPTTHEPLFMSTLRQAGLNKYYFDMANIRDQCSWVHPLEPELATEKAKRLTRMAIANASRTEPLKEMEFPVDNRLLIVGGGIAGMTAALAATAQGCGVFLLEKEKELGGQLRHLRRTTTDEEIGGYLSQLIRSVEINEKIKVYTDSEVVEHSGFVGAFETDIMTPAGAPRTLKHGAIILATGARQNQPELYGLGDFGHVITQTEFEQIMADQPKQLDRFNTIAMIQCAGSRDDEFLPYCSRTCCNQAVKNGLTYTSLKPEGRLHILYRDMRCYGLGELNYRQARQRGINFVRYSPENNIPVCSHGEDMIDISVYDPSIGMNVNIVADLLVLSTGMVPRDTEELSSMLRCTRNSDGFFIEAHAKLRPVDLPVEGLFMAGTAHGPKSIPETVSQAQASVARALTILAKDKLTMSAVVSSVEPKNCAVCLTCVRACPYGVPFINADHSAEINPALCQGCGICVAECPAKTIFLGRYNDSNLFAKIHTDHSQQPQQEEAL